MIPEGDISIVNTLFGLTSVGIYLQILDQENYSNFRVPLGVPYNPGSVSLYLSSDVNKTPLMTIFRDGRIHIDRDNYLLIYRTSGDQASLVLIDANT